ncbi:MAG: hypothetical protein MUF53_04280 [Gemmatimonadaceae bacterium]|jgi:uncharacterized membrane protein|nr:hypothetical protein [Gemmatimonadaceae bacterium]
MPPRQIIALASLVSSLVATYLHLWKIGAVGSLACTANRGCEIAQFSSYGWFLGVDTALIGAVGHALIMAVAALGVTGRLAEARWVTTLLGGLVLGGLLFTIRLKYGEWWVLKTFCPWCQVNTVVILLDAWLVRRDWQRLNGTGAAAGIPAAAPA